ncbi:3-hydroxyacyl-CoA dehydrogenase family protein [Candidatus Bathyarchaeota archaeon]|nr:MAG: 3-hydroxyacyl-CoA dehydrogenase family protein [Candidatus Bathyarchaeota archaeon]
MVISKVCVVGSGFLGTQIGVLSARSGYTVSMQDVSSDALSGSEKAVDGYLQEWLAAGDITEPDGDDIKQRMSYTVDLTEAVQGAGMVIEAVVERLDVKREVFKKLDVLCDPGVVLATNSSSIKVSLIEGATRHPERVLNMHFYGQPWRRRILELMRGTKTTDEALEVAKVFSYSIGVKPLIVLKESTGFIFNRVWRAIKKESLTVADEGVASFEDVDRAWMSLYDTDMGPFGLMDRVGLDVVRDIEMVYYRESEDPRDKPPGILLDRISRGELGVKTGKGFYTYPNPEYMVPGWLYRE